MHNRNLGVKDVFVNWRPGVQYPLLPSFYSPSEKFPEYPFEDISKETNAVYGMVRELLAKMDLDQAKYRRREWNPLGELIKRGDTVLIKPNMVMHKHGWGWDIDSVITHGSIIRAILDYVYIALGNTGKVIIGDAPLQECDFEEVTRVNGVQSIVEFYRENTDLNIEIVDFRRERAITRETKGGRNRVIVGKDTLPGDKRGYTAINLGKKSMLDEIANDYKKFRVTNYDPERMTEHQNLDVHEYLIPNSVLQADVVINLPKIKTHRKAGLTVCLKNLVGINGQKDWLPHHRAGSCEEGGDEYLQRNLFHKFAVIVTEKIDTLSTRQYLEPVRLPLRILGKALFLAARMTEKEHIREGSWYGNDTVWRMVLDLNRILLYADKDGKLESTKRKILHLADGIILGEGEGPLEPRAKPAGILVGGFDPVVIDTSIARLLGLDYRKIPLLRRAWQVVEYPITDGVPEDVVIRSNNKEWDGKDLSSEFEGVNAEPPRGWKGHIELSD